MLKGIYILDERNFNYVYGNRQRDAISSLIDIEDVAYSAEYVLSNPYILADIDVILGSWGMPVLDSRLLDCAPFLKAVFYGAGSTQSFTTSDFWERDIILTSGWAANAVPVAEYTVSQVLFGLKCGWKYVRTLRQERNVRHFPSSGAYGSTVGLVSFGMVGQAVAKLLRDYDLKILVYDPYIDPELPSEYEARYCENLKEIFYLSNVVSIHTAEKPETEGLIKDEHFRSMLPYSTFINTARGSIVRENEMIEVLKQRTDITAVLDVTNPEPAAPNSPLYEMDNVVITPHISGSMRYEKARLGQYMVQELERYLAGKPLKWQLSAEKAAVLA